VKQRTRKVTKTTVTSLVLRADMTTTMMMIPFQLFPWIKFQNKVCFISLYVYVYTVLLLILHIHPHIVLLDLRRLLPAFSAQSTNEWGGKLATSQWLFIGCFQTSGAVNLFIYCCDSKDVEKGVIPPFDYVSAELLRLILRGTSGFREIEFENQWCKG
jgi:hypothetical protein